MQFLSEGIDIVILQSTSPVFSHSRHLFFSHSVVSNSETQRLQHTKLLCLCSQSLLKLMSIESVISSNYLIFCHPLLLLLSVIPSVRVFSNESALCTRWPKYWSFIFRIRPSNEALSLSNISTITIAIMVVIIYRLMDMCLALFKT